MNVKEGDCIWVNHPSGHNTIVDISNGNNAASIKQSLFENSSGNYNQKNYPVNPIEYLNGYKVKKIFRFVLSHPDMDHMDGIEELFGDFKILNFCIMKRKWMKIEC